jgi:hypothetical protein
VSGCCDPEILCALPCFTAVLTNQVMLLHVWDLYFSYSPMTGVSVGLDRKDVEVQIVW